MSEQCLQGLEDCKFVSEVTYKIIDSTTGEPVEVTTYENKIKMSYQQAVSMKYLHFDGNKAGFLKVVTAGTMAAALEG